MITINNDKAKYISSNNKYTHYNVCNSVKETIADAEYCEFNYNN